MTWYEIYSRLAGYLNELYIKHKDNTGEIFFQSYKLKDENFSILPWIKNFDEYDVTSIDPIHIFASFNYWKIQDVVRKKRMVLFCELLENNDIDTDDLVTVIQESDLNVFEYFPHLNITNIVSARSNKTQQEVWKLFSLTHMNKKDQIGAYFDRYENWYGVKIPSLTIFMFWVNSSNFLPLDKNTEALLRKNKVIKNLPNTYEQYLMLIKEESTSLFRILTKVAINEDLKKDLSSNEMEKLEKFFKTTIIDYDDKEIRIDSDKLNIELIPNFSFELYFLIDGIAKKIDCTSDKINTFKDLVIDKKSNTSYPNFQILAIRIMESDYINGLEKNKLYYFTQNIKIENNIVKMNNMNSLKLYSGYEINNINITAIVGKNGTGKSTIVELLIMAMNNLTYLLERSPQYQFNELREFFYTIYTNYSLHGLNEKHYKGEWLNKLFHKNDGYQTPVVIEPYREDGIIDINVLESLTKQRLLATILKKSEETKNFSELTEKRVATHLDISINIDKLNHIMKRMSKKSKQQRIHNIKQILGYKENLNIIELLVSDKYEDDTLLDNSCGHTHYNSGNLPTITDIAKLYICYKVKAIKEKYYTDMKNSEINKNYLMRLKGDASHVTFKLHQAINYLKYNTVTSIGKIKLKVLSDRLSKIQETHNIKYIIELIPPAFFNVDIFINDKIPFSKLSSGEKQEIYTTSSIVYHLQNIESVHQGDSDKIGYKYVNIILDEIELYFHPDMQRKFIYNLLSAIENKGGFNYIIGLNIILVTHSPFILSDIPKDNIMYLSDLKNFDNPDDIDNTFAANIHTLLDNSFFMDDGLMGKFAKNKIQDVIHFLNPEISKAKNIRLNIKDKHEALRLITIIGEPFLKNKLLEMYDRKYKLSNNEKVKEIEEKIKILQQEKDNIELDRND